MRTPMQEHIEWLKSENKKYTEKAQEESSMQILGYAFKMRDCIKHAESMLEKERRAIVSAFAWGNITKVQYKGQHIAGEDYYNDRYNETFNTEECHHKGKYTYNKETFECHKCGLIVPNEYRFNSKEK